MTWPGAPTCLAAPRAANGIDARIIAFLRFRPALLFDFDPSHNPIAFPSPRSWEVAHRGLQKFTGHPQLLRDTLQACVGAAAGIELHAFVSSLDRMPALDESVAGHEVPVPKEIDLQYAVAAALVARAIRAKEDPKRLEILGHMLRYARRFPQREMGVMLVSDMHRAIGELLFQAPEFANWANGALAAEEKVGLKMNVHKKSVKRVMSLLSAMHSPTISALSEEGWYALEVMINEKVVRDIIPKLKMAGASGIVEYQLNKVIP